MTHDRAASISGGASSNNLTSMISTNKMGTPSKEDVGNANPSRVRSSAAGSRVKSVGTPLAESQVDLYDNGSRIGQEGDAG
jgi:hypothetical protein